MKKPETDEEKTRAADMHHEALVLCWAALNAITDETHGIVVGPPMKVLYDAEGQP
jgi:hypothetical protein